MILKNTKTKFILVLILLFGLVCVGCAAMDSSPKENLIDIIDSLPNEITLADEMKILAARDQYDQLSEEEKARVHNIDKLIALEKQLNDLKAIDGVIMKIKALPENIVLAHKSLVVGAREAYNELSEEHKKLITNIDKLINAEKKISELEKIKKDQTAAKKVQNLIINLPAIDEVTLDDATNIENVRSEYNSLTAEQKEYVTNLKVLEEVEEKLASLKAAAKEAEDKYKAKQVEDMIDSLPSKITLEDKESVMRTKSHYDNLTETQKKYVSNYDVLVNAIASIEMLEMAQAVIDLIDDLPKKVTLDAENDIKEAREAYEELSEEIKKLVKNYNDLVKKEDELAKIKEQN